MRDPGGGTVAEVSVDGMAPSGLFAPPPALIRALNEQLLLDHIRSSGPYSRADLARVSGLSKPTVSLALANLERAGLIRLARHRARVRPSAPVRAATLAERVAELVARADELCARAGITRADVTQTVVGSPGV